MDLWEAVDPRWLAARVDGTNGDEKMVEQLGVIWFQFSAIH